MYGCKVFDSIILDAFDIFIQCIEDKTPTTTLTECIKHISVFGRLRSDLYENRPINETKKKSAITEYLIFRETIYYTGTSYDLKSNFEESLYKFLYLGVRNYLKLSTLEYPNIFSPFNYLLYFFETSQQYYQKRHLLQQMIDTSSFNICFLEYQTCKDEILSEMPKFLVYMELVLAEANN